jgi:predicted alpha-1,2-mannosidase
MRSRVLAVLLVLLVLGGAMAGAAPSRPPAAMSAAAASAPGLVSEPASLVNPLAGTGTGNAVVGTIGEFPGADVPFGMMQWSPDTTPDAAQAGSGYAYADHRIAGFSLTHLSGAGCQTYQDVPILPTTGAIGSSPESTSEPFSHHDETAAPGRYAVALGAPAVRTQLAVTTRTGLAQITFPRTRQANLLFKVSGSIGGATAAAVRRRGDDELTGQVTSGGLCGTSSSYTLYFVARFNRPFAASGIWNGSTVSPGQASCSGDRCGAYVRFDTTHQPAVLMKVGISFVSVSAAAANLAAEDPGWSLPRIEAAATARWNSLLGRIAIGGGTPAQQRTFETALYHSLLFPSVLSDDSGRYRGEDGRVHGGGGRTEYANFSEWDIYRSEIELVALVAPHQAGDMVQSLVNDAAQEGWLPKWAMPDGDLAQMNGDSADPVIAAAYAFGVHAFDARSALGAMVKGATEAESPHGLEIERQYLAQYLSQHYVNANALDLDSITYSAGASMTLEYALDDFAIAQLARDLGQRAVYRQMMGRAHNWEYLFNPATGYIQGRNPDGSFPSGPAFDPLLFEQGGEQGFEEGNAIQYTWAVPQDLNALAAFMGGDAGAVRQLDAFFTQLNAGRFSPHDWAGNEPSLWTPWEYDSFGAPAQTQGTVRRIVNTLYGTGPVDEPGNDDLGAISSWYVWAALGLYPVTPGAADLDLAAPLFPHAVVTLPDGRKLVIDAPGASATHAYIHGLRIEGASPRVPATACGASRAITLARPPRGAWDLPWLPATMVQSGGTLRYTLGSSPDPSWGGAADVQPATFATGRLPALGFSRPSGSLSVQVGTASQLVLGVRDVGAGTATTWQARATAGLTLSASSGTITVGPAPAADAADNAATAGCASPRTAGQTIHVVAAQPGAGSIAFTLHTSTGVTLPPVVVDVDAAG